ncbi:DUF1876 domain-containing protein [Streptomyces sp. NPDC002004]
MTRDLDWTVGLHLREQEGTTKASATLDTGTAMLTGHGSARCNPQDVDVPQIGDELAASRAMSDLAGQLMRVADRDLAAAGAGPENAPTGRGSGWPGTET